jgi:hypothetical protein
VREARPRTKINSRGRAPSPHNYRAVRLRSSEDGAAPQPRGADDRLAETHTRDVAWCVGHTRAPSRSPLFCAARPQRTRGPDVVAVALSLSPSLRKQLNHHTTTCGRRWKLRLRNGAADHDNMTPPPGRPPLKAKLSALATGAIAASTSPSSPKYESRICAACETHINPMCQPSVRGHETQRFARALA